MIYTIETMLKRSLRDRHGEHVRQEIKESGMLKAPVVRYSQLYRIEGGLTAAEAGMISEKLLTDPVTDTFVIHASDESHRQKGTARHQIIVWFKLGVTDTVAESVVKAVKDLGITTNIVVRTGHKFLFEGKGLTITKVRTIAERLLVNPIIQEYTLV